MTLELHATPEEVMRAVEAWRSYARAQQIPEKTVFALALALEECGSNIVNHALQHDPQQKFHVRINRTDSEVSLELRDSGPEFDPTTAAPRKLQAEDEDAPGGWGIQLVRRYTDVMQYARKDGQNILRLTKRLMPSEISRKQTFPD